MNDFIQSCGKWFEYDATIVQEGLNTPVRIGLVLQNNSLSKANLYIKKDGTFLACFAVSCLLKCESSGKTLAITFFMFKESFVQFLFKDATSCNTLAGQIIICARISQTMSDDYHAENETFLTKFRSKKITIPNSTEAATSFPLDKNLEARNTWLKRSESQNAAYYTTLSELPVLIYTWNIAQRPPDPDTYESVTQIFETDALFIAIVLQEIDFSAKAVILGQSDLRNQWNETFDKASQNTKYETIFEDSLGGVFVRYMKRTDILFNVEVLTSKQIRLGWKGMTANKSAIITKIKIGDTTFSFLGCHLTPHNPNYEERNLQMIQLLSDLNSVGESDYTIIFGDLNYRVDLPYEEAVDKCNKNEIQSLLDNEQLLRFLSTEQLFKDFYEQPITFLPTYKFDAGCNIYDTSKKLRIPSWTDRIIFKVGKKRMSVGPTNTFKFETDVLRDVCPNYKFAGPSYFSIENPVLNYPDIPEFISYKSFPDIFFSDHRPVLSFVKFQVPVIDQNKLKAFRIIQMKKLDEMTGSSAPRCEAEPETFQTTGESMVTLKNVSSTVACWKIGFIPPDVTVTPESGSLGPLEYVEITIKCTKIVPDKQFVTFDLENGSPVTIVFTGIEPNTQEPSPQENQTSAPENEISTLEKQTNEDEHQCGTSFNANTTNEDNQIVDGNEINSRENGQVDHRQIDDTSNHSRIDNENEQIENPTLDPQQANSHTNENEYLE